MKTTILLTGATGFLGTQIARQILSNSDAKIIALLRSPGPSTAQQRLQREWYDWPDLHSEIGGRVQALAGDVTLPYLGVDEDRYGRLVARVTHIIHAAADIRLFEPLAELRVINVEGTRHVLELAHAIQADHGLVRFGHVSTAYVAGKREGVVAEEDLDDRFGFSTPYEQSKYEAELLVRGAASELSFSIFRPGMIVGDSQTGVIKNFNTLYYPLRMYLTGKLRVAPASPSLRVNLVPVDYVAASIARLIFEPEAAGLTFHLTPPPAELPTLSEITTFTREWARQEMGLKLPKPWFLPLPYNNINHGGTENTEKKIFKNSFQEVTQNGFLRALRASVVKILGHDLTLLSRLLPYFQTQPAFQRANSDRLLGPYPHRWQDFFGPLLAYAVYHSFWHRSQRTVHEQILFRLQSTSKPITFHDLSGGQEIVRPAAEVRAEIETAAAALRALGIQAGDRIAILGPNSTRYLACLTASGLTGAVSTPFYITCPLKDLESLLQNSQARLFLVGTPGVLQHLDEIRFEGQVVSFCREPLPEGLKRPVLSWPEFLALGNAQPAGSLAPVALDAPAALYYTSGTTGHPKGVVYQHAQLRWVAEALASMYPWHERNRWGSYLSYLPMSHVVEGILAIYSPYYVPAALDLYFLEEFDALPWALQTARPTIFFSVPRFFEKVRVAFGENPLARVYQTLPDGDLRRKLLRILLRRGLLRKAGLDRCRQMIVGSAPSIPDLLNFFHDLGVEVHDAYGLTEAPLVSVNRLGHNRIGTVGQPLPETEIRIGPDGEIHVRGPQVAAGYYQNGVILPLTDALDTGDMGEVSSDGYLTLNGRKKDLIITSYAKKISPGPIEASLCGIAGVTHTMLVGEGRPYCTALIWIEENTWSPQIALAIEAGISEINTRLSDPEQIKRWAILSGSLTIENGSLTGSMKMKRGVVAGRLATVIDDLYKGQSTLPGVLYSGGLRPVIQKGQPSSQ
jgi:long-chain acyl-CoA synthetase